MVRRFGNGIVEDMTREQVAARFAFLRERGRAVEAVRLLKDWLVVVKKSTPPSAVKSSSDGDVS
jgi:hypothetical protein